MSELTGDWDKLEEMLNPSRLQQTLKKCAARVGNYGASQVKKGIVSGAPGGQKFASLADYTKERKHSSSPLVDKGDLVGSVTYQVTDDLSHIFIGVNKGKEVNIAAVHEYGCTIAVTPKMRAYLHYNGLHLKEETKYIHIPPRPFLRPVLDSNEFRAEVAEIYIQAVQEAFMP